MNSNIIKENYTPKQRLFLMYADEQRGKDIDVFDDVAMVKMVMINVFEIYLIAENRVDKRKSAFLIATTRRDYMRHFGYMYLIEDKDEFIELVREENKQKGKASLGQQKRRHQKREDFSLTSKQWTGVKNHFDNKCAYCGGDRKLTYDHFHPFSKDGDFMVGNVIPACTPCNSSKKDKTFDKWYPSNESYNEKRALKILKYVEDNRQLALF